MLRAFKQALRNAGVAFFRMIGSEIRDCRTGRKLGRGLVVAWEGRVWTLGFESHVIPVPLPQKRLTYWCQEVGWTLPDAPSVYPSSPMDEKARVLLVVMEHRSPEIAARILELWRAAGFADEDLLLIYGGPSLEFDRLTAKNKILLEGKAHRTRDHQRDRQSYREVFDRVSAWLRDAPHTHVLFHEGDHLPLCPDLSRRVLERLAQRGADVLGYHLGRIDGSTHPHWTSCVSCTYPSEPAYSMLGTGHFWKRAAWQAVSADASLADWYLEMDLPTTAARLGFRLADFGDQNRFVQSVESRRPSIQKALAEGAWSLHPVKNDFSGIEATGVFGSIPRYP